MVLPDLFLLDPLSERREDRGIDIEGIDEDG